MSEERRLHASRDLAELEDQVAAGEIDEKTAARLRRRYEAELAAPVVAEARDMPGIPRRALIATGLALVALTIAIVFAGRSDIPSEQGQAAGAAAEAPVAEPPEGDLFAAMESAIAANPDNLELRRGLADAYFQQRDFLPALNHYLALIEADPPPEVESMALGRVGWMAYVTNQHDAAMQYLEQSVALDPQNYEGKFYLGHLLFYAFGNSTAAVPLLEEVLADADLGAEDRANVEGVLAEAQQAGGQE